jgi:hypothetical protein
MVAEDRLGRLHGVTAGHVDAGAVDGEKLR